MAFNYSYAVPRLDLGIAWEEYKTTLDDFVADQVLPIFRSSKKSAKYSALTKDSLLQDNDANRSVGGHYNRLHTKMSDKSFDCEEFGFEHPVDDVEREVYSSDFDAEVVATKVTARALALQREKRAAALLFNGTTWTGATLFLDTAVTWATVATSTPINDILTACTNVKNNCGIWPNALIVNYTNLGLLLQAAQVRAQYPGSLAITVDMLKTTLASIVGLDKIIVAGAARNSALEGQTVVASQVWSSSNAMVACIADENEPLLTPCVGRSMLFVPDSPQIVTVETYREEQSRSTIVRARQNVDEIVHDPSFAFLLKVD